MPKPITPYCGCDVFITDAQQRVLLIRRSDNGYWALPGGAQNLGETPAECAIRECLEESGYTVQLTRLLGIWSSLRYDYVNYLWRDNEFTHIVFQAEITGGLPTASEETTQVSWFGEHELPPLSDGHAPRITFGFRVLEGLSKAPHFE